jgi:hypothetical protein
MSTAPDKAEYDPSYHDRLVDEFNAADFLGYSVRARPGCARTSDAAMQQAADKITNDAVRKAFIQSKRAVRARAQGPLEG